MTDEKVSILVEKYSSLGVKKTNLVKYYKAPDREEDFIDCGDGWFQLIDTALDLIKTHVDFFVKDEKLKKEFKVEKIKNKLGLLRMNLSMYKDDYMHGVLTTISAMSRKVCETCGSTNNVGYKPGSSWLTPICEDCLNKENE
jgi:hypothetical protein